MIKWYMKALRNYAGFEGRSVRSEFWYFVLGNFILGLIASFVDLALGTDNIGDVQIGLVGSLLSLALLIPGWAVGCRRLHDIGRSGWWQLIGLIPIVGWILVIVWWATDGERGPNRYGPDPRNEERPEGAFAT